MRQNPSFWPCFAHCQWCEQNMLISGSMLLVAACCCLLLLVATCCWNTFIKGVGFKIIYVENNKKTPKSQAIMLRQWDKNQEERWKPHLCFKENKSGILWVTLVAASGSSSFPCAQWLTINICAYYRLTIDKFLVSAQRFPPVSLSFLFFFFFSLVSSVAFLNIFIETRKLPLKLVST